MRLSSQADAWMQEFEKREEERQEQEQNNMEDDGWTVVTRVRFFRKEHVHRNLFLVEKEERDRAPRTSARKETAPRNQARAEEGKTDVHFFLR